MTDIPRRAMPLRRVLRDAGPHEVFVHPTGLCESDEVGAGTRIWAFAHVLEGAVVGRDCNIGDHAYIEGGARIGDRVTVKNAVLIWDLVTVEDDVFLGPNMLFTNDLWPRAGRRKRRDQLVPTHVCRGATIGAGATIVCGITIGAWAFVAAGAVVTRDVGAYALMVGNPARRVGWVCGCGERLPEHLACACGRRYEETADGLTERGMSEQSVSRYVANVNSPHTPVPNGHTDNRR